MHAITRFAPSPTGYLHLGHAYSALMAHDVAAAGGGMCLLRVDDIDAGRCRPEYDDAMLTDLAWLGLAPAPPHWRQSARLASYAAALDQLRAMGLVYPCFCTRADVAASVTAPHGPSGALYSGMCRTLAGAQRAARLATGAAHAWRLDMGAAVAVATATANNATTATGDAAGPGGALMWHDGAGRAMAATPLAHGDIILARRDAPTSYHLSSTVDDAAMGITDVVRGADLLPATSVHRLLQALLGLPTPRYHHHGLIADATGQRLAKRHDALSLRAMRAAGANPAHMIADLRLGKLPDGYRWLTAP
ncbi:MAG: tRNA glutamyl-Q(34) synthetase GluQRS [Sphingopyxis sp.]